MIITLDFDVNIWADFVKFVAETAQSIFGNAHVTTSNGAASLEVVISTCKHCLVLEGFVNIYMDANDRCSSRKELVRQICKIFVDSAIGNI